MYVEVLQKISAGQTGRVGGDVQSRHFAIKRGTKQGDPISPSLFISALECAMRGVQEDWRNRGMGFALGRRREQILCNLRFADGLIIFASSAEQLHTMVEELAGAVYKFGLEIHFGNANILSNVRDEERGGRKSFEVKGKTVEYVSYGGSVEYLGRLFSFGGFA